MSDINLSCLITTRKLLLELSWANHTLLRTLYGDTKCPPLCSAGNVTTWQKQRHTTPPITYWVTGNEHDGWVEHGVYNSDGITLRKWKLLANKVLQEAAFVTSFMHYQTLGPTFRQIWNTFFGDPVLIAFVAVYLCSASEFDVIELFNKKTGVSCIPLS